LIANRASRPVGFFRFITAFRGTRSSPADCHKPRTGGIGDAVCRLSFPHRLNTSLTPRRTGAQTSKGR
jgi:hypothetical protein